MAGYDPRVLGAKCDQCMLGPTCNPKGWAPVPPEDRPGNLIAAVGEAPGAEEEIAGRPFVGRSGQLWEQLLTALGITREQVSLFNLLSCRPPGNKFDLLAPRLKKENARRQAAGAPLLLHPAQACLARCVAEVSPFPYLILLGGQPTQYLLGEHRGILSIRGVARLWGGRQVMPTLHPAFALRRPHFTPVIAADLRRGLRGFSNTLEWAPAHRTDIIGAHLGRPAQRLYQFFLGALQRGATEMAYDVETDGKQSPWKVNLRTFAAAYGHEVCDGQSPCTACLGWGYRKREGLDPILDEPLLNLAHIEAGKVRRGLLRAGDLGEGRRDHFEPCAVCGGSGQVTARSDCSAVSLAVRDLNGASVMSPRDEAEALQVIAWAFYQFTWIGHNAGYYDKMVMWRHCGHAPPRLIDTILIARAVNAELSKALGVWGPIFCDVPSAWKADNEGRKLATQARSLVELLDYNVTDAVVTLRISGPMRKVAETRGYYEPLREDLRALFGGPEPAPMHLAEIDLRAQALCVDMHTVGMQVDPEAQAEMAQELQQKLAVLLADLQARARDAGWERLVKKRGGMQQVAFNPASTHHVAELLYTVWDLVCPKYTETEAPSTDDEAILELLLNESLPKPVQEFLKVLRAYRSTAKILGTYVTPADESEEGSTVWPEDHRVHASWNCHTPNVGRFSCSGPNLQNVLKKVKRLYVARPGHILIGCDVDQLHLRIIANEWKIPLFLDAFLDGIDPHGRYASMIYPAAKLPVGHPDHAYGYVDHPDWLASGGYDPKKKPPKHSKALLNMRNAAKAGIYIFLYCATAETAYKNLRATPGKDGVSLPFLHMAEETVVQMREVLLASQPFEAAWGRIRAFHKRQGYLASYLFGRRSDVATYKAQEEVNFPVLATERDILAIIEHRVQQHFRGKVVNQCHDALTIEVPIEEAETAAKALLECFHIDIPGWQVPITGTADIAWFIDDRGKISEQERLSLDPELVIPPEQPGQPWAYKTDFGGRLRSRWIDT